MVPRSRVLFIDAYDSFSNNIISLLETQLGVAVTKVFIDSKIDDLPLFLKHFDAVVCGPGPGHPGRENDVGLFQKIWALAETDVIPTLGICLGFQSLGLFFGGAVSQLPRPRHGQETYVVSSNTSLFHDVPQLRAVQYHSLHVTLGHDGQRDRSEDALWVPSEHSPQLIPLAWDLVGNRTESSSGNPAGILMSVRHALKPFYGVQFHPESICSDLLAQKVVENWWALAQEWNLKQRRNHPLLMQASHGDTRFQSGDAGSGASTPPSVVSSDRSPSPSSTAPSTVSWAGTHFCSTTMDLGVLTLPKICEMLDLTEDEVIILDSEMRPMKGLGESSIVGLVEADTIKIHYRTGNHYVTIQTGAESSICSLKPYGGDVFVYLKDFVGSRSISEHLDSTFCGGLMGYITYEAGLETIDIAGPLKSDRPDICFAFVERSIVLDHVRQKVYIQSLKPEDDRDAGSWLAKTEHALTAAPAVRNANLALNTHNSFASEDYVCNVPSERQYRAKILACQEQIRAGESYELCLTDQTTIKIEETDASKSPWLRYTSQRRLNRAPFSAYIRLGALTLLSSSPERFLCWSRPTMQSFDSPSNTAEMVSTCQFRPIKGTVKKQRTRPSGAIEEVTLKEATTILSTPKERAENLMIVDLIRHDLHGVAGSGNVSVPSLMVVEEYETVYQLVSVIEGRLRTPLFAALTPRTTIGLSSSHPANEDEEDELPSMQRGGRSGIEALAAALPPGSMTGAPKRRACRLLRDIEGPRPRSIYSGVVGYMCVTGKGDFSVVIRTAYRWDDETYADGETWHIGAGGAITDLSTEDGEWDEMLVKLQGTLRSFAPGAEANLPP